MNCLFVTDFSSKLQYIVDSRAEISVIPPSNKDKQQPQDLKLYAVNGSTINTFGTKTITLNLGLRRPYCWPFVIAEVTRPKIRADLLKHFGFCSFK
jgi:cleavage and polyadenylation specificity factor subunit 1